MPVTTKMDTLNGFIVEYCEDSMTFATILIRHRDYPQDIIAVAQKNRSAIMPRRWDAASVSIERNEQASPAQAAIYAQGVILAVELAQKLDKEFAT